MNGVGTMCIRQSMKVSKFGAWSGTYLNIHYQNCMGVDLPPGGFFYAAQKPFSPRAEARKSGLSVPLWGTGANVIFWKVH